MRLWLGRKLIGLGFLIAPDSYFDSYHEAVRLKAKLDEFAGDDPVKLGP